MKSKRILLLAGILVAGVVWIAGNPPGQVGWSRFGWTSYNCIPHPISDVQIRSDGKQRTVKKAHDLQTEHIQWLLEPKPEILIIATGWDGVTQVSEGVRTLPGCEVRIMKTGEAIPLFNSLRKKQKVALHLHSTC